MMRLARHGLVWAIAASLLFAAAETNALIAAAADSVPPANEHRLPAWIGNDVGLCLEFDNLAQQSSDFYEGPLAKRLRDFPPIAVSREQYRPQLAVIRGEIERRTGATARDLVTCLLSREVLFAIWPPVDPVADKPSALVLAEAADADLMRLTLDKLVTARRQAGRWRGQRAVEIGGESFAIDAVAADDDQSEFYITSAGNVAMIATSEPLLRSVLERRAEPEKKPSSLAASPVYLSAGERLVAGAAARLFINPRAWDDALAADLKTKQPGSDEARSQAVVVAAWRATEYVAGALHLTPRLGAELAWKWRADDLPDPLREVAASFVGPSEFVNDLPADALAAFAGHADVGRLVRHAIAERWQKFADARASAAGPPARSQNEDIFVWALAAGLEKDWGGYLIPTRRAPAEGGAPHLPVDLVLGIQTRPLEPDGNRPALAQNVEPFVHALLSAAVEAANRRSGSPVAAIESVESDRPANGGRRVTVVSGIVPDRPGQELAYCVEHDRFWLGTSAASLERVPATAGERLLDDAAIQSQLGSRGIPSGLVYVNLAGWRKLASRGRATLDFLWQGRHLDARTKDQQYQELLALLRLADRLLLTSRVDESTVQISVGIAADN